MVAFKVEGFAGEIPRMSDRLLPENFAAAAFNTDLYSGEIKGFRRPLHLPLPHQ